MADQLLKAVEGWSDLGLGRFQLRYLRDKLKRELDFLVVRDRKPWLLVEAKTRDTALSDSLRYFQIVTRGIACISGGDGVALCRCRLLQSPRSHDRAGTDVLESVAVTRLNRALLVASSGSPRREATTGSSRDRPPEHGLWKMFAMNVLP